MKKLLVCVILLVFFTTYNPAMVLAIPPDFAGGINDENIYEEVVFLSGTPVKFSSQDGKFIIKESEKSTLKTITYTIKLTSVTPSVTGTLDRSFKLEITSKPDESRGQTVTTAELKNFKESIKIGSDTYILRKDSGYQFSKSDIIDNRPASDFYSGTITARKYYEINKNQGTAVVEIRGGIVGFQNFWGNTETQIMDYSIAVDRKQETQTISWQGSVKALVSDSTAKQLQYAENEAKYSSFVGGYMRLTNEEMASKYDYDLPRFDGAIPQAVNRNQGSIELNREMLPQVERLIVPKFRDTGGHWAQEEIEKLYSLDVFEGNSPFFLPSIPMTRIDFIHGVVKACDIRVSESQTKTKTTRKVQPEKSPFSDLSADDPNFSYVKDAINKGIVQSIGPDYFGASEGITRAQAVAVLIRALGFDSKAPSPPYQTAFADDSDIPPWARDSVYVAREIGLVGGDLANYFRPDQVMTRAEAAIMLSHFLDFLQKDLQEDYRDQIVLYN